ncbi:hypothetical protein CIP107508_02211 [Corynebacterium diphtheriae]|nr:hypothetical protein CIP107508_02211 [Corynebacterium diphtheriae]
MESAPQHSAVVTLWFVTTAHPEAVIAASPRADRGFGRKLLAQMNSRWPITPIGQFSLNRSAQASTGEFYIAGFPGLSVIQTVITDARDISAIDSKLRGAIPAADVYAFAVNPQSGLGAFAHWSGDTVKRAFSARRERVYEDTGLPEPFENAYWAGEKAEQIGGIALPFKPIDLVTEAQRYWLGFDIETAQDINVVAYAIDGRPEPKLVTHPNKKKLSADRIAHQASAKLGLGESRRDYDDYEEHDDSTTEVELVRFADAAENTYRRTRRILSVASDVAVKKYRAFIHALRHTDKPSSD